MVHAAYMKAMSTFNEADHPRVANGQFTDKPQSAPEVDLSAVTYQNPSNQATPDEARADAGQAQSLQTAQWRSPRGMTWAEQVEVQDVEGTDGTSGVVATARLEFAVPARFSDESKRLLARIALATDTEPKLREGVVTIDIDQFFSKDEFTTEQAEATFNQIASTAARIMAEAGYRQFAPRT